MEAVGKIYESAQPKYASLVRPKMLHAILQLGVIESTNVVV